MVYAVITSLVMRGLGWAPKQRGQHRTLFAPAQLHLPALAPGLDLAEQPELDQRQAHDLRSLTSSCAGQVRTV
jgi:hypothetical protein